QLAEDGAIEMQPALAQLPSVTPVGMASLLPGANDLLELENQVARPGIRRRRAELVRAEKRYEALRAPAGLPVSYHLFTLQLKAES
ncbi:hypothetical protein ACPF7Z_03320, partial [Halomonas sp. GXIMD04776]